MDFQSDEGVAWRLRRSIDGGIRRSRRQGGTQ
jgi:hypothetical protein